MGMEVVVITINSRDGRGGGILVTLDMISLLRYPLLPCPPHLPHIIAINRIIIIQTLVVVLPHHFRTRPHYSNMAMQCPYRHLHRTLFHSPLTRSSLRLLFPLVYCIITILINSNNNNHPEVVFSQAKYFVQLLHL